MPKYEIEKSEKKIIFRASADLAGLEAESLLAELGNILSATDLLPETAIVFDLKNTFVMGPELLRGLASLARPLKRAECKFYTYNTPRSVYREIAEKGLDSVIQHLTPEDAAKILKIAPPASAAPTNAAAKPAGKFDVGFVNPFIDGAINTLKVQCSIEAKAQRLTVKGAGTLPKVDIAGVIGITSDSFNGSIAICFPKSTFLAVMGSMLGETYTEITRDVEDGAGELLNIIFGQAKVTLNEKGYGISKAIPTIVTGQALQVRHLTQTPTILVPFETTVGPFHIEIGVEGKSL